MHFSLAAGLSATPSLLATAALLCAASGCASVHSSQPSMAPITAYPELSEATVAELQQRMERGTETSRSLVLKYLARIDAIDRNGPALHSVIELNPDALAIADALDAQRSSNGSRGPLHGIPILVKDNIATADRMLTTAGSLSMINSVPSEDAFIVKQLRASGAVILGKTNLSEWANIRSTHSSSGWSARGGQTKNPYALDRNPSGSSSGSAAAIAASLAAIAVGTETDGSIVSPSGANGLVGMKPTVGLVSRTGIIPISHTQDTAGPMARTVMDAAILLEALAGADPSDAATGRAPAGKRRNFTAALTTNGLQGVRIGVVRGNYMGGNAAADRVMEAAIIDLKRLGAVIVDPADIPISKDLGDYELEVLLTEFKADLALYLASLGSAAGSATGSPTGSNARMRSLADVIRFNQENAESEMPYFGQELFLLAELKGPLTNPTYLDALAKCKRLAGPEGIDKVMDELKLDALVAPTGGPAWLTDLVKGDAPSGGSSDLAAISGYPNITVPAGQDQGLPIGISFFGRAWSDAALLQYAYAYEQGSMHRKAPEFGACAVGDAN